MLTDAFSVRRFCRTKYKAVLLLLSTGLLQQCLQLLMVFIIGGFFELVFQQSGGRASWMHQLGIAPASMQQYLWQFGALLLLRWMTDVAIRRQTARMEEEWSAQLREALFAAQVLHYPGQFSRRNTSRYLLRYSHDVKTAQQLISKGWIDLVRQLLVVSSGLLLMWWLYPPFGSIALLWVLAAAAVFIGLSHFTKKSLLLSRSKQSALLSFVAKQFQQFRLIQANGKAVQITHRFNRRSQALLQAKQRLRQQEALIHATAALLPASLLLVLFTLAWQWGGLNYANAMMLVLLIMQWQSPIRKLLRIPGILQKGNVSLQKMKEQWIPQSEAPRKFTKQNNLHIGVAIGNPK